MSAIVYTPLCAVCPVGLGYLLEFEASYVKFPSFVDSEVVIFQIWKYMFSIYSCLSFLSFSFINWTSKQGHNSIPKSTLNPNYLCFRVKAIHIEDTDSIGEMHKEKVREACRVQGRQACVHIVSFHEKKRRHLAVLCYNL